MEIVEMSLQYIHRKMRTPAHTFPREGEIYLPFSGSEFSELFLPVVMRFMVDLLGNLWR
jgi:hypothetical protein